MERIVYLGVIKIGFFYGWNKERAYNIVLDEKAGKGHILKSLANSPKVEKVLKVFWWSKTWPRPLY